MRWAIGGAIVLALIILIAARGKSSSTAALPMMPGAAPSQDPTDDLQQIADQANSGDVDGALQSLDDYEERNGESKLSHDLRRQLERAVGGPPGKRKHKHGD